MQVVLPSHAIAIQKPHATMTTRPFPTAWLPLLTAAFALLAPIAADALPPVATKHVTVYAEPGRFGGWPANSGIWHWGDEILVSFARAWFQEHADTHSYDRNRPSSVAFARSLDGGESWTLEEGIALPGGDPKPSPGGIDFTNPGFALRVRDGEFHISYDRGHTWAGPYAFPDFGVGDLSSRTDYLVQGPGDCLIFMSAKDKRVQVEGEELQDRAFCARTRDGGKSFQFVGWMTGEPVNVRSVMPATVRADDGRLVTTLRRRYDLQTGMRNDINWIDACGSDDDGKTWSFLARLGYTDTTMHNGNPPSLVKLPDGRIAAAWGVRSPPYGIHGRVSGDGGRTWGPELVLRDDARKFDIGYCRSVPRSDGRVVTVYYYTTVQHPENFIAATIWTPPPASSSRATSTKP